MEKDFLKYTGRLRYITHKMFGKGYAAIHETKPVLILNKPIYVRFTALDLGGWLTYDFHCNFIKKNSLTYEIKSENVYEEFLKWRDLFDFSNYPKDSKFFNETNKNVIDKMKDEFAGVIVNEFVGLKSKMYSMKKIDGKKCNAAKGVSIVSEFKKFKDFYLIKQLLDTK